MVKKDSENKQGQEALELEVLQQVDLFEKRIEAKLNFEQRELFSAGYLTGKLSIAKETRCAKKGCKENLIIHIDAIECPKHGWL